MATTATVSGGDFQGPVAIAPAQERLQSVDILRGIVMVLMALDHVRDYLMPIAFNPSDPVLTTAGLFWTRWITHFCAPVFVFLAGTSAYLSLMAGKPKKEVAKFLLTRGLWLMVLELLVIRTAWDLNWTDTAFTQVIWVLGLSMVCMAGLIFLPIRWIAAFGLVLIFGHNLLDPIRPQDLGPLAPLWTLLHDPGGMNGIIFTYVAYPLIPWVGVMAVGYAFGILYERDPLQRRNILMGLGLIITVLFFAVRGLNIYGDPAPWALQSNLGRTILSFFNTQKYPPSLSYLLMTLGPSILLLAWLDRRTSRMLRPLMVFGRVPLFYYIIHLYLVHAAAIGLGVFQGFSASAFLPGFWRFPQGYGLDLIGVYISWAILLVCLYPLCHWYAGFKKRHRYPLLSYL